MTDMDDRVIGLLASRAREDVQAVHAVLDAMVTVRKATTTQKKIAKWMGVKQPVVSEFETETSDPRLSTLQRYARAIGGKIEVRFVGGSDTQPGKRLEDERQQRREAQSALSAVETVLYGTDWTGSDPIVMRDQLRAVLTRGGHDGSSVAAPGPVLADQGEKP